MKELTIEDAEVLCDVVLESALDLGLVDPVFVGLFEFRAGRHGSDNAWGGAKTSHNTTIPLVRLGRSCREFSFEKFQRMFDKYTPKSGHWKTIYDATKRGEWTFIEYAKIAKDPEIGEFISDDPYDHVMALLCHEVAHAIGHYYKPEGYRPPHGPIWQATYRQLRNKCL